MFKFLRIQYRLGKIDKEYLQLMVTKGKITEEQYEEIINEE